MPSIRDIVRIVLVVVCVAIALYLLWLLRKPISWLLIAMFLAIALSPPVNVLNRHMRRGFAIALTYLGLLAVPVLLIALIVPPLITEANNFADNVPKYADDVTEYVQKNKRLREINKDYDITQKLEEEAKKLPNRLGGAAGTLRDIGFGIVTLFENFPTATIVWVIWAIVYQQIENHVIQPQIQKRTVNVQPLITIVAVLFGATLLGVLGALVAIPIAASIQILVREYVDLRTLSIKTPEPPPPPPEPAAA